LLTELGDSFDKYEEQRGVWGGGLYGNESTQMFRKRAKAAGQSVTAAEALSGLWGRFERVPRGLRRQAFCDSLCTLGV